MTETLKNGELILPSLYSWHDDFVKADLEEHCRFVRRAAETEPVLTEMIFTSPAPLLIRVAAFEHFVMSIYRKDDISTWICDFVESCECKGNGSRLVHDSWREKWLCDHNGIDPEWEEPYLAVTFGVCASHSATICQAVKKTVDEALLNRASEHVFTDLIVRYPEWIDSDKWPIKSSDWSDLEDFLGETFGNMAQVFYMLHTDRMTHCTGRQTASDSIWRKGWLSDACNFVDTADGGPC